MSYRRGKKAHLDVTGERGSAIQRAIEEQLGLTVLEVKPVGLEGSGGSTPLRLQVAGDPETYLFAKLYAKSHVTADRWYKLGRTILYGALEDEAPFQTVRRLVEYEDYTLRVLRDAGIPTAAAYGIVEITPEREYMLVTGFFDGAAEIGERRVVDDRVIDEGLACSSASCGTPASPTATSSPPTFGARRPGVPDRPVLRAGAAVAVASGRRPGQHDAGPGGALRSRARVRARAEVLHPDEIAEAFAATRGVASPTQLRAADEAGRARPPGPLPGPGPGATAHRHPALERAPLRARPRRGRRWSCSPSIQAAQSPAAPCRTSRSPRRPSAAPAAP